MVRLQPPALQIFIPAQPVPGGDVAAQGFSPIPTLQTNHVLVTHGLAHRDSRVQHLFDGSLPSKLTKASVYGGDEVGKLTGPDCIMAHVTPDDFRSEKWTDGLGIHGSLRDLYFTGSIYESGKHFKDKILHTIRSPKAAISAYFPLGAVMIVRKPVHLIVGSSDLGG